MMPELLWIFPVLALPCGGWFAAAWYYKRKIRALKGQVNAVRQAAGEHANQSRRQIGQLQAELAARPPRPSAERERRAVAAATEAAAGAAESRRAAVDRQVPSHGFAATAILSDGFAATQVME